MTALIDVVNHEDVFMRMATLVRSSGRVATTISTADVNALEAVRRGPSQSRTSLAVPLARHDYSASASQSASGSNASLPLNSVTVVDPRGWVLKGGEGGLVGLTARVPHGPLAR